MAVNMLRNGSVGSAGRLSSIPTPLQPRAGPTKRGNIAFSKRFTRRLLEARNATTSSGNSSSEERQEAVKVAVPTPGLDPATQFSSLANAFGRRLLVGTAAAAAVALGGNLGGITSLLLGLEPAYSRELKLDVVYPVNGYKRCLDTANHFEFVYPSSWVGDQRLLYRAVAKAEKERLVGLLQVQNPGRPQQIARDPIVAFGPPGSNGELNVSVMVVPIPTNFKIEKFGDPKQTGEVILSKFIVPRSSNIAAVLIDAKKTEDYLTNQKITYYNLEYTVQSPTFFRHNLAIYTVFDGKLYTLNAQCPEALWPALKGRFYEMADAFKLSVD
uniref:PsbP C-terminal domain-containing protein n=1 Tax=Araucaria cunninghamii TaxID=56994 RepID=A0A0D6QZH2_ARACU